MYVLLYNFSNRMNKMEELPQLTNEELIKIIKRSSDPDLLMDLVPVHSSFLDNKSILEKISAENICTSADLVKLGIMANDLLKSGRIDTISTIDLLEGRLEPYPYQLKVAINVLKEKSSIALLADEVGLGKTIEVGLVLKEHIIRENIHSILIITPKALIGQWQQELREKFDEEFITSEDEGFDYTGNKIIISFSKLARNINRLNDRQWDMVAIDEAHLLSNMKSKRRQAVAKIDRRYMLLSTATPLCNRLTDIYSLVDLLYPGLLGTQKSFKQEFFADRTGRICRPEMKEDLKKIISKVMVRTLRKDSGIPFTQRHIYSLRVEGTREENRLYDRVLDYMKDIYTDFSRRPLMGFARRNIPSGKMSFLLYKELITLQQSLSSSPRALVRSLENRKNKHENEIAIIDSLIKEAEKLGTYSKAQKLLETLNGIPGEKAIIFTLRLETAYMLCDSLNENFMPARIYEGKLSGYERWALINDFNNGIIQYIVATDSAAEGLNLQEASIVVNYDLHWNPMKIEQRIGRIHRRGQKKDVNIFNIVMKNSIDDYVLKILYEKIDLFKMTIGGIESILSEMKDDDFDIEEAILEIILRASNKRDMENEMEKLKEDMEYKKEQDILRHEFSHGILD